MHAGDPIEMQTFGTLKDPNEAGKLVNEAVGRGAGMQTFTGAKFYPAAPRADEIDLIDIAHALGHISRYGGHCTFYSVAEHSVLVSQMVPIEDRLAGLLHDATEAYIADIIRPVKRILGPSNLYFQLEERVWWAVCDKFGLSYELPESVKIADQAICGLERKVLHPRADEWDIPYPIPQLEIRGLAPFAAAMEFLVAFMELTGHDIGPDVARYTELYLDSLPESRRNKL